MFQKKLIVSAVAGVAALGLSAAAFGGTYMAEDQSAFYLTVKAGYADDHWDDFGDNDRNNNDFFDFSSGTFGAGADLGYQINEYFAGEVGLVWIVDNDGR